MARLYELVSKQLQTVAGSLVCWKRKLHGVLEKLTWSAIGGRIISQPVARLINEAMQGLHEG
jgi:hypothetical protein